MVKIILSPEGVKVVSHLPMIFFQKSQKKFFVAFVHPTLVHPTLLSESTWSYITVNCVLFCKKKIFSVDVWRFFTAVLWILWISDEIWGSFLKKIKILKNRLFYLVHPTLLVFLNSRTRKKIFFKNFHWVVKFLNVTKLLKKNLMILIIQTNFIDSQSIDL